MDRASIVSRIAHEMAEAEPSLLGQSPWWERLDSGFHRRPERFRLDIRDRLWVKATAAIDVMVRTAGASMVGLTALPFGYHPGRLRQLLDDRKFYQDLSERPDPSRIFEEPPKNIQVRRKKPSWPYFKPWDGFCEDLSFESPFVPVNPRLRDRWRRHRSNRIAHARHWRHKLGPRPTIVAIHGFGADPYWLNEWFFALPWFYKMGCDVLLFTLPFHGKRQGRFSPFGGHGFFAGGAPWINEAFTQAVFDFRIFLNYLQETRDVENVGVTGVSLGGYTAALLAAVEPRLKFSVPNVPVVSIADVVMEWEPVGMALRAGMRAYKQSIHDIRRILSTACPLTYPPVLPKERLMIIGGVGDRLAPPKHTRLLWDHWGRCRIHWFPGSHILHFDKGTYLKQMARFLTGIWFIDWSYV